MSERRPPGFNVDLGFSDSKEVLSIPARFRAAAIGVWTLCGCWSAAKLQDGYVPAAVLKQHGCTPTIRRLLITSTLWIDDEDTDGIRFTRWPKWQRTRGEIEAYRAADAERKRESRKGNKSIIRNANEGAAPIVRNANEGHTTHEDTSSSEAVDMKTPSSTSSNTKLSARTQSGRPQNVRAESLTCSYKSELEKQQTVTLVEGGPGGDPDKPNRSQARGQRLPETWKPTNEIVNRMVTELSCDREALRYEHRKFVDYWLAKSGKDATKTDWNRTWCNWMRTANERRQLNHKSQNGRPLATSDQRVADILSMKSQQSSQMELE